jgi:hypothetical protein
LHLKFGTLCRETAEQPTRSIILRMEAAMKPQSSIEQLAVAVLASLASLSWLFVFVHGPAALG